MATLPWLYALALLGQVCWGFLKPSAQARPNPGRGRAALLSTWQAVALQDYLLPRLPPHPQLEESPRSSLSAACSPRSHGHPLHAVIRARGSTDTSTVALSTTLLPVLIFLPRHSIPLGFSAQKAGSEAEPHLLPLQSPMPAVSPSPPARLQSDIPTMQHCVETEEALQCHTALHARAAQRHALALEGPQVVLTVPTHRGSQALGAPAPPCLLQKLPAGDGLQQFGLRRNNRCGELVWQEEISAWCAGGKARTGWSCRELSRVRLWLFPSTKCL